MIIISNLLLIVWATEAWLFLVILMMLLERLCPSSRFVNGIRSIVDPVFETAKKVLSKCLRKEISQFSLRLVTIFIVVILRYILISLIVAH